MRAQLGEIAWLDKVKQNFSEEQFYKDMARAEEHNLSNQYSGSIAYNPHSYAGLNGDIAISSGNTGILSHTDAQNLLYGQHSVYIPPTVRNTTGLGTVYLASDYWYACSNDGNYFCVQFEDGQAFATDSMTYVRIR